MQITNRELEASVPVLNELLNCKLPGKVAFKLVKLSKDLEERLNTFRDSMTVVQRNHVKVDEDGNYVPARDVDGNVVANQFEVENPVEFQQEINELREMVVDLDFEGVRLDDLGENFEIEPVKLRAVDWLIVD
jgi:hypothetical protein